MNLGRLVLVALLAGLAGCVRAGYTGDPDAHGGFDSSRGDVRPVDASGTRSEISRATVQGTAVAKPTVLLVCGSSPANDCRGALHVGLYRAPMPPFYGFVAGASVPSADLSGGVVSFAIHDVPPGSYSVWAFLAESGSLPTPPAPVNGDPVIALPVAITVPGTGVVNVQLTLPGRWLTG